MEWEEETAREEYHADAHSCEHARMDTQFDRAACLQVYALRAVLKRERGREREREREKEREGGREGGRERESVCR
jgi:hypothetical protein